MERKMIGLIVAAVLLVAVLVVTLIAVDLTNIEGNQIGVKETWSSGVETTPYQPGMKVLFPGWSQEIYKYDMSPHIFVMNDRKDDERAGGRPHDAYIAKSADNQQMTLWLALQWRLDPAKIVDLHKRYRTHVGVREWEGILEERLVRQVLMHATNTEATKLKAIDAYSGEGFVRLQQGIFEHLVLIDGELRSQGIIVENFVIEQIHLDPDYIGEINKRQVAQQRELRAQQEEKASLAEAQRAKADAQSDYEKRVVEAERDKQVQVLASEAAAAQQVNAATAQAKQVVLAANAEREAAEARASAILAIGTAEAESKKLQLSAYAVPGAEAFVTVEVSKQMAIAFQGIQGYLPSDMQINLLSDTFMQGIRAIVGGAPAAKP